MRIRILLLGLLLFCIPRLVSAQQDFVTGPLTAQAAACPISPGMESQSTSALTLGTMNAGGATFTIGASAFSGTVSFFGSGDGALTWQPLNVFPSNSTTPVTTATATGVWQVNVSAYTNVCMVVTTFTSGTITATIRKATVSARAGGGGGGAAPAGATNSIQINNGAGGFTGIGCLGGTNPLMSCTQAANGNDTVNASRFTDTTPTGTFMNFMNAANNATLFSVDVLGNATANSYQTNGAGAGYFQCSNGNGTLPTLVAGAAQISCPSGAITNYQMLLPTAAGTGCLNGANVANVVTLSFVACSSAPAGSVGSPQIFGTSTTLSAQGNTFVIHGGSGALAAFAGFGTTANTHYLVDANDTETTALTITAAGVTVECPSPSITIQQTTASTRLFNLGSGANNFTVRNCGLSPVASGTAGDLVGDTAATPVNYIVLDNVELFANSSTATGGFGVNISGGAHHFFDIWDPAASYPVINLDSQAPSTHNPISDVTIRTSHGQLVESNTVQSAIRACPNGGTATISYLNIDATILTADMGINAGWSCNGLEVIYSTIKVRTTLSGNSGGTDAMFSVGCGNCLLDVTVNDGGFTALGGGIVLNDSVNVVLNGVVRETNSSSKWPFQALDSTNFTLNLIATGNMLNGISTNGWSTTIPCAQIANSGGNGAIQNVTLGNIFCSMPPSSTADGIDVALSGTGNPIADNLIVTPGVRLIGVSGAGTTGIKLSNTSSGGSSSYANPQINSPEIKNFPTAISISSLVSDAQVVLGQTPGVTNKISDSGVRTQVNYTYRNVTPVTATANVATEQTLMEIPVSSGFFNSTGTDYQFYAAGVFTTPVGQTPTLTFKAKLCTISGCGSGTVVPLVSIITSATLAASTNNNWNLSVRCSVATGGATGNMECHGPLDIDLGALTTSPDSMFNDVNTAVSGNIDLTAALFLDWSVTTSSASGSNAITQRLGTVKF